MDPVKILIEKVFRPLYFFKEGQRQGKTLKYLSESQYYIREKLEEIQLHGLKELVDYAAKRSQYYREIFPQLGITAESITSLRDIKRLPVLRKDDLRNRLDDLLSDEFKRDELYFIRTGGSTGVRVKLFTDRHGLGFRNAVAIRHDSWTGYTPGAKLVAVWGDTDKKRSVKARLRSMLLERVIYLDTLKMNPDYIRRFVGKARKFRPQSMMGHAHSIYKLACFLEDNGLEFGKLSGVITTAEMLLDHEREKIEAVFGKIVFNRYGCEEVGLIASECEAHDGMHINADGLIVEVEGGDEQNPGKILITDLKNHAVPLIRYEIGDMATIKVGPCACGRGLPRLGKVAGRTSDFLYTPEGGMVSGISILDTYIIHIDGFRQVQIIQNKIDELDFKIIKSGSYSDDSLVALNEKMREVFGPRIKLNIEFVDHIPLTERGKFRFTICNIQGIPKRLS